MKTVVVGYGLMFQSLIEGIFASGNEIVGVLPYSSVKKNVINKIKNFFKHSEDTDFIKSHGLKIISAKGVNDVKFRDFLIKNAVDVVIVGSWGEKFSQKTLDVLPHRFINVHPSLLPKFRGPNPYSQVLLNPNLTETGITFHLIDKNYDSGDILHQKKVEILKGDTGETLKKRCCVVAKSEIAVLLNNFDEKLKNKTVQNESEATYQKRIDISETILNFEQQTAVEISAKIRAFHPWSNCYIPYKNNFFACQKAEISDKISEMSPGTIIEKSKDSFSVVCSDGSVVILYNPKLFRPFSKFITPFYIDNFVKINYKAI